MLAAEHVPLDVGVHVVPVETLLDVVDRVRDALVRCSVGVQVLRRRSITQSLSVLRRRARTRRSRSAR